MPPEDVGKVVKGRLDESNRPALQTQPVGKHLKRHGRRKTHEKANLRFIMSLPREQQEIGDVGALQGGLRTAVDVPEQVRGTCDNRAFVWRPATESVAVRQVECMG